MVPSYNFDTTGISVQNIEIEQGELFSIQLNVKEDDGSVFDLTNYSGFANITTHYGNSGSSYDFIFSREIESSGVILVFLPPSITSTLPVTKMLYEVDISGLSNDVNDEPPIYKVLRGRADIYPEI